MANIKDIKNDLLFQLQSQNKIGKFYDDLVDDYISFYKLKNDLKKDIKNKGLRYKTTNGNGFTIEKPNESVTNLPKINSQMLKILSDLGLHKPSDEPPEGGDESDLL